MNRKPDSLLSPLYSRMVLAVALSSSVACAGDKLDMSFIQGGVGLNSTIWDELNSNYSPGRYLVELILNGNKAGKQILDIAPQDRDVLCLKEAWLTKAGVYINQDYFRDAFNAERQCYVLTKVPPVTVDFDVSTQTLSLAIPQKGLVKMPHNVEWDYGTNAFRVNYNMNANTGRNNTTAFGSTDLKANVGRWVVNSSATATRGNSGDNTATINMLTATRVIRSMSADLMVGKTSTGDSMLGSTSTYGVSLSRNNSMKPGNLGYIPVFSGIARGPSRVILVQNGNQLYSEMMPAGPFSITDVSLYTSGDVTMRVIEEDGQEHVQVFPLSVIAGLLSPEQHEFSIAVGVPEDVNNIKGGVSAASYGYGLDGLTLRVGGIFNQDWHGVSVGSVIGLGYLGIISVDGANATAKYQDGTSNGNKVKLAWGKLLDMTKSDLRVTWSRQSKEYEDFSSFDPADMWRQSNQGRRIKDEWTAGISQPMGEQFVLSVSGWQRSYYQGSLTGNNGYRDYIGKERGLTGSMSTRIKGVSVNVGMSGSKYSSRESNWSASASVSVPFTLFERRYSISTAVSTNKNGATGFSTGVSGSLNERFSYGFGQGINSDGYSNNYLNASYSGDQAYFNGSLNHSSGSGNSGSVSASGSVLAVPAASDVMFSRISNDTVAVVSVKDTQGVRVMSGNGETNSDGNLVVPLSSYDNNTVTIDAGTLPLNNELGITSKKVVPTSQAVVWMPFDVLKIRRYLLQVRQRNGEFVPGGTWARNSKNTPLGFVVNNGVLMINAVDAPGDITLEQCLIPALKIHETEKLQEITCE